MENEILDSGYFGDDNGRIEVPIVNSNKFILLYLLTFGIYGIWWMYKSWKFFKEKENLDIMPAARAIFAIFFAYGLFDRIKHFANHRGEIAGYSPGLLFVALIVLNLMSRLPDPAWLISFGAFLCFIPPLTALNQGIKDSDEFEAIEEPGFNTRQIVLIVLGISFWILVLIGLMMPATGAF